jgi:hypothetical protein
MAIFDALPKGAPTSTTAELEPISFYDPSLRADAEKLITTVEEYLAWSGQILKAHGVDIDGEAANDHGRLFSSSLVDNRIDRALKAHEIRNPATLKRKKRVVARGAGRITTLRHMPPVPLGFSEAEAA